MFRRIAYLFNVFIRSSFFFWFMVVLGLLTALFGPRLLLAQPVTLTSVDQWRSVWEGLAPDRDVSLGQIGRASCRERVSISAVGGGCEEQARMRQDKECVHGYEIAV